MRIYKKGRQCTGEDHYRLQEIEVDITIKAEPNTRLTPQ